MIVKDTGGNFENAPQGTHLARCVGLTGIGSHESDWKGKARLRTQIIVTWELPYEMRQDGQPFITSQFYTRSLSEKANLRNDLKNWRGRDFTAIELQQFDLKDVLDKGCQVVITENDKGKTYVTGVAGLPKGTDLPDRHNELKYFDVEEWNGDEADPTFSGLSEKLQTMVKDSLEYGEIVKYGRVLDETERKEAREGTLDKPFSTEAEASDESESDDSIPF